MCRENLVCHAFISHEKFSPRAYTHSFPLLARFLCRKTNKERTTKEQMRRDRHKRKLIVSVLLGIGSMECCVWMCMAERKCVFLWGDLFVMSVSKSSARWMKWLLTLRWNFGTSPFEHSMKSRTWHFFSDEILKLECENINVCDVCHKRKMWYHVRGVWMGFYAPFARAICIFFVYLGFSNVILFLLLLLSVSLHMCFEFRAHNSRVYLCAVHSFRWWCGKSFWRK